MLCGLAVVLSWLGSARAEIAFTNYAGTSFNTIGASPIRGELWNPNGNALYRSSAAQFTPTVNGVLQSITVSLLSFPPSESFPNVEASARLLLRGDVNNLPGPTLASWDLALQADTIIHQLTVVNDGDATVLTTSTKYWVAVEPLTAYSAAAWYHGLVNGRRVDTYPPETGVLEFDDVSVGTMHVTVRDASTTTTVSTTTSTTSTTLPGTCGALVGTAHAACVLDGARSGPLCGSEVVPSKVGKTIANQMKGVGVALEALPGSSGRKLTRLLKRIDRGLAALDRTVSRAAGAKAPARRISAECAATIGGIISAVRDDLAV